MLKRAVFLIFSLALSGAALASGEMRYFSDPNLVAQIESVKYRVRHGGFFRPPQLIVILKTTVQNTSSSTANGPFRIAVQTPDWIRVANADSQGSDGKAFVDICRDCQLTSGESVETFRIRLRMPLFRALSDLSWTEQIGILAQYKPFQLQLLHTADMDGTAGALQNVASFSAILSALRSDYPDNTLVLSSGDNYIPGPRFAACADESLNALIGVAGQGRCDIVFMNAMGFQASAVGNHDLDGGTASFASIIDSTVDVDTGASYPGAAFPYLSSNLDFSTDVNLAALVAANGQNTEDVAGKLAAYTVAEVAGQTIGIVGATTPTLASITNTGDITVSPADAADIPALAAAIQQSVDELTSLGVNKIIVLAHMQQIAVEAQLASLLSNVDVIVAGGSNTLLADDNDVLRDGDSAVAPYPLTYLSATQEPVLVVNTDGDYKYLGRLVSAFDLDGRLIVDSLDTAVNGVYASTQTVLNQLGNPAANTVVEDVAAALSDVLAARDGNILGRSNVYLDGRRGQVRTEETNLGNLTADANLAMAKQVDPTTVISIKNGGGIRAEIGFSAFPPGSTDPDDLQFFPTAPNPAAGKEAGDISQFDIETTLRFNNGLTLLTVTALELQAIIEHGVSATEVGATPGRFPQVSGLRFSFDPALPANARVRNLAVVDGAGNVIDAVIQDGVLVGDAARTFRIVTLGFLAGGGDGFPFPATDRLDLDGSGLVPAGLASFTDDGSEQDALAEYLLANFPAAAPFDEAETSADLDTRIQNLSVRADSVF